MTQENIPLQSNEEILPIRGYEGLYSITNFGRVWSHRRYIRGRNHGGYFLKWKNNRRGYPYLNLSKSSNIVSFKSHILAAIYYIPNPQNLPEVNHKDGNKQNNFAGTKENNYEDGNLEWCTRQYNENHAVINGLKHRGQSSNYRGVYYCRNKIHWRKPWCSDVRINRKQNYLGHYKTEIEAAQAYNKFVLDNKLDRPLNQIKER